jgi:hypothetical protein
LKLMGVVDKTIRNIEFSIMKLKVAINAYERSRRSLGVDRLFIVSMMYGVPINYHMLGNLYVSSALKDMDKALKNIGKIRRFLEKHVYLKVLFREHLDSAEELIRNAKEIPQINNAIEALNRAVEKLREIRRELERIRFNE